MARLVELSIRNFRGFGSERAAVSLDADLVLFYGPNGFCKTSLAEALEWLFYGHTKRRQRGEQYSTAEYSGTYDNVHGGRPVEVSARVRLSDGSEHRLTRRMAPEIGPEASITLVGGCPADFASIGLAAPEAVYPVIVQHGLQSFIHSKPKERRDAISAALGLDELAALKSALDGARKSFMTVPPSAVTEARNRLRALAPALADVPETARLAQRWQKTPPEVDVGKDMPALVEAARRLTGAAAADAAILADMLRAARLEAGRTVFDAAKLAPGASIAATVARIGRECDDAAVPIAYLGQAMTERIAAVAAAYAAERLAFWEAGLGIAPDGDDCPMCEAPTLTAERRAILRWRLEESREAVAKARAVDDAVEAAGQHLQKIEQACAALPRPGLSGGERDFLRGLMAGAEGALDAFLQRLDALDAATREFGAARAASHAHLSGLPGRLADGSRAPQAVADQKEVPGALLAAARACAGAARAYADGWEAFETTVAAGISSSAAVRRIDAVLGALTADGEMRTLALYDSILSESKALMQSAEAFLQAKQVELLGQRGAEVQAWYDMLNPGADVAFDGMEPGTGQLKLHARSFGIRMGAAANLSECQLNCLGLAVWMMRATTPSSPFGFIVLDDPIQSMDDDHCEAFIASVIPRLMDDHGKQVIMLSHVENVVGRLRDLNVGRRAKVYHFDGYTQQGPTITAQAKLNKLVSEVRGLANGNEANRLLAVDRLRVLVEQIIRELHVKIRGCPAPPQYDNAKPADLLRLFQSIPGTTPDEYNRLRDTVGFADPAHHTEVGYAPPLKTNILPHLDRLRTIMEKYGL